RPPILLSLLDVVQLLGLLVIAEPVDAVVHPEELTGSRTPVEADGVAQARGEDRSRFSVRRHPQDGRALRGGFVAGIAGAADREVKVFIRSHADRPVRMLPAIRQV